MHGDHNPHLSAWSLRSGLFVSGVFAVPKNVDY